MSRRRWGAIAVLGLWVVGLGFLVRRELFRPDVELFAEMGLRVTPSAMFYAVMSDGRHVGFASSTVDTTATAITVVDYLVADLPAAGGAQRISTRTAVSLSRGMRLQKYAIERADARGAMLSSGRVDGDSVITAVVRAPGVPADTQRISIPGPVLMPTLLPLAVALGRDPGIGRTFSMAVFDPGAAAVRTASLRIAAETLLVVHDSAVFARAAGRWSAAIPVDTRAWQVASDDSTAFSGWIDEQGRVVRSRVGALELVRMPYALAYLNWVIDRRGHSAAPAAQDDDVLETTALAAGVRAGRELESLAVRLAGVDLDAFDLASSRQARRGDTLTISRDPAAALDATYRLGEFTRSRPDREREEWSVYLRNEPLVETMDPDVRRLAARLRDRDRDPRIVAERIQQWVHDSLAKQPGGGIPSARAVLESRAGDASDHTQLYIALARSAGIPARAAVGLVHVGGKFYSHAWPEVYLGRWVAIDPTLGQFPADASHVRFVVGRLDRQAELLRLIGTLDIDVLETR